MSKSKLIYVIPPAILLSGLFLFAKSARATPSNGGTKPNNGGGSKPNNGGGSNNSTKPPSGTKPVRKPLVDNFDTRMNPQLGGYILTYLGYPIDPYTTSAENTAKLSMFRSAYNTLNSFAENTDPAKGIGELQIRDSRNKVVATLYLPMQWGVLKTTGPYDAETGRALFNAVAFASGQFSNKSLETDLFDRLEEENERGEPDPFFNNWGALVYDAFLRNEVAKGVYKDLDSAYNANNPQSAA